MNNDMEPRMLVERDLIVRTRINVGLATDVFRPPLDGPFPVLLDAPPTINRRRAARSVPPL